MSLEIDQTELGIFAVIGIACLSSSGRAVRGAALASTFNFKARTFEPILQRLSKAGILSSSRGQKGGYLVKNLERLTFADIAKALQGRKEKPSNSTPAFAALEKVLEPIRLEVDRRVLAYYVDIKVSEIVNKLIKSGQMNLLPEDWLDYSI